MTTESVRALGAAALAAALVATLYVSGWNPELVGIAGALTASLAFAALRNTQPSRFHALDFAVAAFVCWNLVVTIPRGLPWISTYQVIVFALLPLGYLVARLDREFAWGVAWSVLVIAAGCVATLSLVLTAFGESPNVLFDVRNNQAAFLNVGLFLSIAPPAGRRLSALARYALVLVIAAGVAVTVSRGALVALVASATVVLLLVRSSDRSEVLRHFAAMGVGVAVGALLTGGWLTERVVEFSEGSFSRWNIWFSAVPVIMDQPIVGHGLGMTEYVWAPYRFPFEGSLGRYLHNDYLQFALEGGFLSAVLLAAIPLAALRKAVGSTTRSLRVCAAVGAVAVVSVHCLVDYHLQLPSLLLSYGLVLGMLASEAAVVRAPCSMRAARISLGAVAASFAAFAVVMGLYSASMPVDDTRSTRLSGGAATLVLHYRDPLAPDAAQTALASLTRAVRFHPLADEPLVAYAGVLRQSGRLAEAEAALVRAIELNPYAYHAYYQYALVQMQRGELTTAEANLREATRLRPRFLAAQELLVGLLDADGRDEEAYRQARIAILNVRNLDHRQLPFIDWVARAAHARDDEAVESKIEWLFARRALD